MEVQHCSWCFSITKHKLINKCLITRNVFQCEDCGKETCKCLKCPEMTRRYADHADKLCYSCKLLIPTWNNDPKTIIQSLKVSGRCSWCFASSKHTLYSHNTATRSEYTCDECSNRTISCRFCDNAMARNHQPIGDQLCAKCDGTIKDWERPYETGKSLLKSGWCSWCITLSIHELDSSNIVRRNYYKCLQCNNRTLECFNCKEMSRGGFMWNDNLCVRCFGEDKRSANAPSWEALKRKRDAICRQHRDLNRVEAELQRDSTYRAKCKDQGVERPFLLLVSMPTMLRNQISCQLGWTIFTQEYFGDSHAEAFHILNDSNSGMQARANQSYERLNPLAHNCNWYDILVRVMQAAFHCDMEHKKYKTSLPACQQSGSQLIQDSEVNFIVLLSQSMKAEIERKKMVKEAKLEKQRLEKEAQNSETIPDTEEFPVSVLDAYIPKEEPLPLPELPQEEINDLLATNAEVSMESDLFDVDNVSNNERQVAFDTLEELKKTSEQFSKKREQLVGCIEGSVGVAASRMADETSLDVAAQIDSPVVEKKQKPKETDLDESIAYIKDMILKNTGIQREEVGEYAIQLGMTCAGVSKLSVSIMCLKLGAALVPTTAGVALPAAAALSLFSTPMFIIGIFSLAAGAVKLGFGSSEGRLVMPVITILNQRLLLAIEDINIDDYY